MSVLQVDALGKLNVPANVRKDLETFLKEVIGLYQKDLISMAAFGSAVAGSYIEEESDLNVLIIYSELDMDDLEKVSCLAQKWFSKRKFMPRFLSKRNLTDAAKYFQIDWMEIRDTNVLLYGEDVLASLPVLPQDMKWQLVHEIKRMRMRIKQQYWRAAGNQQVLNSIIIDRVSSIVHLMRVFLFLKTKSRPPVAVGDVVVQAAQSLGFERSFVETVLAMKKSRKSFKRDELPSNFQKLLELIRVLDQAADNLPVA